MNAPLLQPPARIPGFDGLRALACLAVFGVHLQQLTAIGGKWGQIDIKRLLENGNTGVCLFFMLSGFLLSLPFWIQRKPTPIDRSRKGGRWLFGYTLRRLGRILPAYYLCLTALVLLGKAENSTDIAMHYALIHNFREKFIYSISDPFWTLAVQAQLYIIFALLMLLLAPLARARGVVAGLLIVGIIVAFLIHRGLMSEPPGNTTSVVRVSTLAHLPHFMLGMLAAAFFSRLPPRNNDAHPPRLAFDFLVLLATAAMLAILAIPSLDDRWRLPSGAAELQMIGRYNFPYVPLLLAIILIFTPHTKWCVRLLEWSPLRMLGVISFGIYVFHLPCLQWAAAEMAQRPGATPPWVSLAIIGGLFAVAVSAASYLIIEQPLMRWLKGERKNSQHRSDSAAGPV